MLLALFIVGNTGLAQKKRLILLSMTNTSSLNNKYAEENKNRFNPFQKLILIFTLVCVQLLWANDKESLKADFLSLAKKYNIPAADIYVSIGTTKESILKHNSETKVIPASLTKLMVASAVLDTMPANLQFSTYLKAKSYRANGIYDEVCLMGGGDPSFVSEDMWKLVNQALRANLKQVSAKILVDESYFDDEYFHEGRQSQRVSRAYDAPVSAMSFNWNSVNLYIRPGDSRASAASVFADPKNDYIVLKADVKTGSKEDLKVERIELADGRNQFNVSGSIAIGAPEKAIYRAISKPSL